MRIALVGKMRSGKDTVGKYFMNYHGFKRFAFAEGITNILNEHFPEIMAQGKPRGMYLGIGQQFREYEPNVWINYTDRQIKEYLKENPSGDIVITDTRQLNEYKYLKDNGFIVIKVEAKVDTRIKRMQELGDTFSTKDLEHDTEKQAEAMPFDYLIHNDGTVEELFEKVERVLINIRRGLR